MEIKYAVGDTAWWPTFGLTETSVECPDCGGTGRLRVKFHDDTEVSIGCANCGPGFNPSTGRVKCYDRLAEVKLVTISGMEISEGKVEYRTSNSYRIGPDKLFDTQAEAQVAAEALAKEYDREEREKIFKREKDGKSWAWHATYHRRQLKRAEKDIVYHTKKLNAANLKANEVAKRKAKR